MIAQRIGPEHVARLHPGEAVVERDPGAGDRGGAGAAVGLDDVAVDGDLALAERLQVDHGAQAAPDQALDLDRAAALLAGRGLAPGALGGRARQHAVFGGDPAAPLALEPGRQPVLQRGGHQHVGVAEFHEAGAFGVFHHAALERDGAQLVRLSAARPQAMSLLAGAAGARCRAFRGAGRADKGRVGVKPYSGWMPASLIILLHLSSWTLTKSSSSSGELENASKPSGAIFALVSGLSMILRSSALSCVTNPGGVPAGREEAGPGIHVEAGHAGLVHGRQLRKQRAALDARHRERPQRSGLTCGRPVVKSMNIIETRPASRSWIAGGALL